jgi:hypothetical protein
MYANPFRRSFDSFGALPSIALPDVWARPRYSLRISSHVSGLAGMTLESGAKNEIADGRINCDTHEKPNGRNQRINRGPLIHRTPLRIIIQRWHWPQEIYDQRDQP